MAGEGGQGGGSASARHHVARGWRDHASRGRDRFANRDFSLSTTQAPPPPSSDELQDRKCSKENHYDVSETKTSSSADRPRPARRCLGLETQDQLKGPAVQEEPKGSQNRLHEVDKHCHAGLD